MRGERYRARFALFKRLLAVAQEEGGSNVPQAAPSNRPARGLAPEAEPVAGRSHRTSGT
jgi:hypothetical protein